MSQHQQTARARRQAAAARLPERVVDSGADTLDDLVLIYSA
jgi:hypothetical protein